MSAVAHCLAVLALFAAAYGADVPLVDAAFEESCERSLRCTRGVPVGQTLRCSESRRESPWKHHVSESELRR